MPASAQAPPPTLDAKLSRKPGRAGIAIFILALTVGCAYAAFHLVSDLSKVRSTSIYPYLLLGAALLIALGFEFVNGFHDTANAVATVIYTHSLQPYAAVAWSGLWNFLGVVTSSGAVAFGIISLLPVELILKVGSGSGFAMVFALLTAAIVWNLGTWYLGLPSSSSHTLVGSIIGVGIANQLMSVKTGTSGVDWAQAANIGKSLLISPTVGFLCAALLLIIAKKLIPDKRLYQSPVGNEPPPFWIRGLLLLTCTGVSFAHGSNDGQKGMGLIMLILIGTVPTAYALNHAVSDRDTADFAAVSIVAVQSLDRNVSSHSASGDPVQDVTEFIRTRQPRPETMPALRDLIEVNRVAMIQYKNLKSVPAEMIPNFRNNMYLISEALRVMKASGEPKIPEADWKALDNYKKHIDESTKYIPLWVKVAVAMALGLGTMIGWKRVVVTVGEKIGKAHLTYAQGAAAEITAMLTIGGADTLGMPVSTTHVLSSGVAGAMAANHSGLQWGTVRNLLLAWFLTMPASIVLAGSLFWLFRKLPF